MRLCSLRIMSVWRAWLLASVLGLSVGCTPPDVTPSPSVEGRWIFDPAGLALIYWFYSDGTAHRESTISVPQAGYYSANGSTVSLQFIGSAAEAFSYTVTDNVLTLTVPGMGALPFQKQASLDKPANDPPAPAINEGDITATAGTRASLSAAATHVDASGLQTLSYLWYVDGAAQAGSMSTTFDYDVPLSGPSSHSIKVAVSDGYDVASDTVTLSVTAVTTFEQWNGSAWVSLGVGAPVGTVDSFTYNGALTVRLANNEIWTWTGSAWTQLAITLPAGTVQVTSFDMAPEGVLIEARDSSLHAWWFNSGAWTDVSTGWAALPAQTVDFLLGGQGIFVVLSDGTFQLWQDPPRAWAAFRAQLQGVRDISIGLWGVDSYTFIAVTSDRKIYSGDSDPAHGWVDTGVTVPAGTLDTFIYERKYAVRR